MELNVFYFLLNENFTSNVYIFKLLFCFLVHMSTMVRRRIWQLHSLNQLMLGDAFRVGMNLLGRCHNLPLLVNLRSCASFAKIKFYNWLHFFFFFEKITDCTSCWILEASIPLMKLVFWLLWLDYFWIRSRFAWFCFKRMQTKAYLVLLIWHCRRCSKLHWMCHHN